MMLKNSIVIVPPPTAGTSTNWLVCCMISSIALVRDLRLDPSSRSKERSSAGSSRRTLSTRANLEVSVPNKRVPDKSLRHVDRWASMAETVKEWSAMK